MPAKRRPAAKSSPPEPSLSYSQWRAKAGAELERRYDVKAGTIPHRVWRDLYIRNLSPENAADQASVSAYNVRRASDRVGGRRSEPKNG